MALHSGDAQSRQFLTFFVSTVQIVFSETFACLSVDKCKSDEVGLFQSKDAPWLPL
jgi:hypothetical protein